MRRLAPVVMVALLATGADIASAVQQPDPTIEIHGRRLALSRPEVQKLSVLRGLLSSSNRGAQDRALADAELVATSPDARYLLAVLQLEIGLRRSDDALRLRGLDVLLASTETPRRLLPGYLGLRGDIAYRSGDHSTAESAWARLAELQPGDPQPLFNLAQVRAARGDPAGAVALLRRAIATPPATGRAVPESWHRQWLSIAYNGGLIEETAAAGQALVAAHPTPANWRLALVAYRQLAAPDGAAEVELLRLMRAAGAFAGPDEYQRLAQLLLHGGSAAEAKAVLDDGLLRGTLSSTDARTRDIGIEIDRALARRASPQTPSAPLPAVASEMRRATSFLLAGSRSEAEAILRPIAEGATDRWYPDLARFWLIRLRQESYR